VTSASKYGSAADKYLSPAAVKDHVVAFSVSYQRENMLARGMGLEHLNELLIRLARRILRQKGRLAYGGHWQDTEDNFMFPLLRLVSAEQQDQSLDTAVAAGGTEQSDFDRDVRLYNHLPWPYYLDVSKNTEAKWINSCRIIRISQQLAGIPEAEVVPDANSGQSNSRTAFNKAITLSAMRRQMMQEIWIEIPGVKEKQRIPPVTARILLGGKVDGYAGFLPGIFEEALTTWKAAKPVYILGGFGGAAEILANAILGRESDLAPELTRDWHKQRNPTLAALLDSGRQFTVPSGLDDVGDSFELLRDFVMQARENLSDTLRTGLTDDENRELLGTGNIANAVRLAVRTR
jgi:SLOG cluster2